MCLFFSIKKLQLIYVDYGIHFRQKIFCPTRKKNCLDNIFSNIDTHGEYAGIIETSFSDHDAQVFCTGPRQKRAEPTLRKVRPLTLEGYNLIHRLVSDQSWDFVDEDGLAVDECFRRFHQIVVDSFLESFPEKTVKVSSPVMRRGWFTQELRDMRENLILLTAMYERYRSSDLIAARNQLRARYRKAIKTAIINYFDKIINKSGNKSKTAWRLVGDHLGRNSGDGLVSVDPNRFNKHFSKYAETVLENVPPSRTPFHDSFLKEIPPRTHFSFKEVGHNIVRDIVANMRNSRSADFYGLSVDVVKKNINPLISPLTKLINRCLTSGTFPACLKISKVIPVHKKGDKYDLNNYRPISLVPIFSKILEKVVSNQIVEFLEENCLLTSCQYGFRKGKSTTDAILQLIRGAMDCFENKKYYQASFIDLTKAFDCVTCDRLLYKLKRYGFDEAALSLVRSFLSVRSQVVSVGGELSGVEPIETGVVQGSTLGPILFIIDVNDFPDFMTDAEPIIFVDDTTLTNESSDLHSLEDLSKAALSRASDWFASNGLCVNEGKTQELVFSLRDMSSLPTANTSVKFLGVYLDASLTWAVQIDSLASRLSSNIFALRVLSSSLSTGVLKTAYFALVETHLRYGVLVWGNCAQAGIIFGLQRRAMRVLGGLGYRDCYTHEHDTRNRLNIRKEYVRLSRSQRGPDFSAATLFNKLPVGVRGLPTRIFKDKIKKFLLSHVLYSVDEFKGMRISETDFH
ncbi:uncharacterized protein LOC123315446 [Coccinella septempunctata]|uniref:uncharacterized protein LOC123315446 n=1 Tax=Coccinella septempunctata TaxID=41139 RepID=UPI001D088794|nr:uncharacterized protein LOC123315446 [Coccinella septempunctata]